MKNDISVSDPLTADPLAPLHRLPALGDRSSVVRLSSAAREYELQNLEVESTLLCCLLHAYSVSSYIIRERNVIWLSYSSMHT